MSTSTNLPAGFSITSINGQRCTAVPRASTTLTGADAKAAAAFTTSTTSTAEVQPNVSSGVSSAFSAAAASSVTSTTSIVVLTSSTPITNTSSSTTKASVVGTTALPASKVTTPTTSSSTVAIAVALSDSHPTPTIVSVNHNTNGFEEPSKTALISSPASTSDQPLSQSTAGTPSKPRLPAAPVVGGVMGAMCLIAVLLLLFWVLRRRKLGRESLLTPLTTSRRSEYYGDNSSVAPEFRGKKWKAEFGYHTDKVRSVVAGMGIGLAAIGASLKSKVVGDRSDTPSVNLNRGNSQFLEGPIPQHSRNNSVLSNNPGNLSLKDRLADWWERVGESISFGWRLRRGTNELADPFATARGMTEKQANMANTTDFSQLLGMSDRDLQLRAERRRASMSGSGSVPQIGSLGLGFNIDDPFADPIKTPSHAWKPGNSTDPFADPKPSSNPFADPAQPERSIPKVSTYITDIRRSRGQSVDATNRGNNAAPSMYRPPSTAVGSRYPSSIAPSRDSYRDTVLSSFSANVRKGKGRSDPFDLERPELWRPKENTASGDIYPNYLNSADPPRASRPGIAYTSRRQQSARVTSTATYTSKYSSGVSSLGDWGEPGPDLGPGSGSSSLRANAGSSGVSTDSSASGGKGLFQENMNKITQEWDEKRGTDNVSPQSLESKVSSKGSVGKAL